MRIQVPAENTSTMDESMVPPGTYLSQYIPNGPMSVLGFGLGFPRTNLARIPNGPRADPERIPNGLRTDPARIPNGPRTDLERTPRRPHADLAWTSRGRRADPKRTPERTPNGPSVTRIFSETLSKALSRTFENLMSSMMAIPATL